MTEVRVIGAGWGRTGTSTLKQVLETLGFGPSYHWSTVSPEHLSAWEAAARGEEVEWDRVFAGFGSITDWPATWVWRQLIARYPDAKVILTTRDPQRWFESARETIYALMSRDLSEIDDGQRPGWSGRDLRRLIEVSRRIIIEETLGEPFEERPHEDAALVARRFREHVEAVKAVVDPDRLLVYEVSEGWGPLCAFLGVDEPEEAFPHRNRRRAFEEANRPEAPDSDR